MGSGAPVGCGDSVGSGERRGFGDSMGPSNGLLLPMAKTASEQSAGTTFDTVDDHLFRNYFCNSAIWLVCLYYSALMPPLRYPSFQYVWLGEEMSLCSQSSRPR